MSYTFGANSGDDLSTTSRASASVSGGILMGGWFLATTLTSTRTLIGTTAASISVWTTTSSLRLIGAFATTSSIANAPINMVLNKWQFIMAFGSGSATPAMAWRVWAGDIDNAPVEFAVTQTTAPVGAPSVLGAGSSVSIGNVSSAGSQAWQGRIGPSLAVTSTAVSTWNLAATGTISQDEADYIYQRFVLPSYRGQWFNLFETGSVTGVNAMYFPMDSPMVYHTARGTSPTAGTSSDGSTATLSGATVSLDDPPIRPISPNLPHRSQFYVPMHRR